MSKPILVGYDPRSGDRAPVDFGATTSRLTGAPLIVACVQTVGPPAVAPRGGRALGFTDVDDDLVDDCTPVVDALDRDLRAAGIRAEYRRLESTSAARALHEGAETEDAGLLVVGSAAKGKAGAVLRGATAERLLHGSPCPVAIVPQAWKPGEAPSVIGVAYVDSDEGREALRSAHALARRAHATLRVITVLKESLRIRLEAEPTYIEGRFGRDVEEVLGEHILETKRGIQRAVDELRGEVSVEIDVPVGDPADVLVELSEHLDVLVCGSRGYGPVRAVLLGSVSRKVTSEARCPVVVLPRGVRASLEALLEEAPGAAAPA